MRRATSILLLLLFSFPLITPLFASAQESNLPACCRRNGAHHCLGMADMVHSNQNRPSLHERCPYLAHAAVTMQMQRVFMQQPQSRFAAIIVHPTGRPQTEARYRIAFSHSRQKRGPPVTSSL